MQVPANSKWRGAANNIEALYDDLRKTAAAFRLAWVSNVSIEEEKTLVDYQSKWASEVLKITTDDGQITYLVDYASRYPQVAL